MKTFSNSNARSPQDASSRSAQARKAGRTAVFAGGGSDVLQLVKERIVQPDVIVNLKTMANLEPGHEVGSGRRHRGPDDARHDQSARQPPEGLHRARRGGRQRGDAADSQRRHDRRQRVSASVVLVLPERLRVLQERRESVLLVRRREPVPRDLRRRSQLYRPSVRHGARAGRAWRHLHGGGAWWASAGCLRQTSSSCHGSTRRTRTSSPRTSCSRRLNCRPPRPAPAAATTR